MMRRSFTTNFLLILLAAAVVGLLWTPAALAQATSPQATSPQATSAQATSAQADKLSNMESHIGKLTGHAKDADRQYRRYCVGCHGEWAMERGERAMDRSQTAQLYPRAYSSAAPPRPGRCPYGLRHLRHHRARV